MGKARIQYGEQLISDDESLGIKFIKKIENDDLSFFNYSNDTLDFYLYLNSQYFRTTKLRNAMIKVIENMVPELRKFFKTDLDVNGNNIYSQAIHGLILKMSVGMFMDKNFSLTLLKSKKPLFITSDQPVINMCDVLLEDGTPEAIKYLMPISPYRAIIIDKSFKENKIFDADEKTINYLNEIIAKNSYEITVGYEKELVVKYPPSIIK